jgi:hypothetical protein
MKHFTHTLNAVLLTVILLAGCTNVITEKPQIREAGEGSGFVTIQVGGPSARTLYPDLAGFTRYELNFAGSTAREPEAITGGSKTITLALGAWTITATAYTGEGVNEKAVARGSAEVVVSQEDEATAAITLLPIANGEGTFSWNISFPTVDTASLLITGAGPVEGGTVDLTEARSGELPLMAGYYLLQVRLTKGIYTTGRTEVLHIYPDMTSRANYTFTAGNFTGGASLLIPEDWQSMVLADWQIWGIAHPYADLTTAESAKFLSWFSENQAWFTPHLDIATFFADWMLGIAAGPGNPGTLTIKDVPTNTSFALWICEGPLTADNYTNAMTNYTAMGTASGAGGTVYVGLKTGAMPPRIFAGNGTYSVLVMSTAFSASYVQVGDVPFSNGAAEISWNALESVTAPSSRPTLIEYVWSSDYIDNYDYDIHEYQFYAQAGKTYAISWTGNFQIRAVWKYNGESIFPWNSGSGLTFPETFTAEHAGTVIVQIQKPNDLFGGDLALRFWEKIGNATLEVNFQAPGENLSLEGDMISITQGSPMTVSASGAENYTRFRWVLEGTEIDVADDTVGSLELGSELAPGVHHLTVIAYKDGVPYSRELTFAVIE